MARLDSITVPVTKRLKHFLRESASQDGRTLAAYVRQVLERHMRREPDPRSEEDSREREIGTRSVEIDRREDHEG